MAKKFVVERKPSQELINIIDDLLPEVYPILTDGEILVLNCGDAIVEIKRLSDARPVRVIAMDLTLGQ